MKLGPVTKLHKKNKTTSQKFDYDSMSENCDAIAIFKIYGQCEAIQKLGPGCIVCKICVFVNSNLFPFFLFSQKWKTELKISNAALTLLFRV